MVKAKAGDRVKIHYTQKARNGKVLDTSKGSQPLEIRIGSRLVPLFEEAVLGLQKGDTKEITVPPEKAYGEYDDGLIFHLQKSQFADETTLRVGGKAQLKRPNGGIIDGVITRLDNNRVILDANHPMAGKTLVFEIEVIGIA